MHKQNRIALLLASWGILIFSMHHAHAWSDNARGDAGKSISIPAGDLRNALETLARQTGIQLLYDAKSIKGLRTDGVKNAATPELAVVELLRGTPLATSTDASGAILISAADKATKTTAEIAQIADLQLARAEEEKSQSPKGSDSSQNKNVADLQRVSDEENDKSSDLSDSKGIPEILVKGKRSLNTDMRRTEDDPQPYVVFDQKEIERSQAVNLEDFLRTRLPMNTASSSSAQASGDPTTLSSINLRGLGQNQTLILLDGRRMPGVASNGTPVQADVNGVPLSAIERIEVLPSTAGGIHGGSATGGVVNIILRRDFRGLDAKATYGNTFDTDAAFVRLDANVGFALQGGRTQVMLAATHSEANNLLQGDRDFAARAIGLTLRRNQAAIIAATTPPLGATVNIRSAGGNLVLDNGTSLVSSITGQPTNITHLPVGYAGPASDNGAALVANAGRYNLDLPDGVNGMERGLVSAPSMDSVSLNLRREFGERLEAFLDLSRLGNEGSSYTGLAVPNAVSNLPAGAPNNPFQQPINVRFPTPGLSFESRSESTTVRATGGLIVRLPRNWMGEADYGWSRSRLERISTSTVVDTAGSCVLGRGVAANVDPDGAGPLTPCVAGDVRPALNALQEGGAFPIDFTPYLLPSPNQFLGPFDMILKDATLRFSGPAVNLPGGSLSLVALIARREESMQDAFRQTINATTRAATYAFLPHSSQDADSYYLEARAPLISHSNELPFVRDFELQASVRHDKYKTMSDPRPAITVPSRDGPFPALNYTTSRLDSTDYTLGVRYAPLEDLTLRASFGTGFLPPSVIQIAPTESTSNANIGTDPRRGDTNMYVGVPYTRINGGSPRLGPEKSRSASAGLIITPRFAPGFRLSIDYARIEKVDEIQSALSQFFLDNEAVFPGRIVRGANLAGDPAGWAGPITSIDTTLINIAMTTVEAYDIQTDYTLRTERLGEFHAYALATRQTHYKNQVLPASPVVDSVGFAGGPLEWRGNLGLDWDRGPLTLSWNAQRYHAYRVYTATALAASIATTVLNQGSATIPSQTYHDFTATYRFDGAALFAGGVLADSEISLGIQNLFDESPPILASTDPASPGYSTYGDPRLRRYSISLRKSFH